MHRHSLYLFTFIYSYLSTNVCCINAAYLQKQKLLNEVEVLNRFL